MEIRKLTEEETSDLRRYLEVTETYGDDPEDIIKNTKVVVIENDMEMELYCQNYDFEPDEEDEEDEYPKIFFTNQTPKIK